ncbi:MAG: GHKL domain-containing protein [Saprospiraceae bacterium]|nr:GHKL domain-containing protein [Saprospiraceae bacterium]
MQEVSKPADLVDRLSKFETFKEAERDALQWLVERSTYQLYEPGEHLFFPKSPATKMIIIMEGELVIRFPQKNELREVGTFEAEDITGLLPFSRMKESVAYGVVNTPMYTLELDRSFFIEMVNQHYALTQILVGVMSNRIREFTQTRLRDEKLMSLGKLSAGLAHELNNPASSIVRNAEELYQKIHKTPESFKAVMSMGITPEETDQVNAILFEKIGNYPPPEKSLLDRESQKDDLIDWLEDAGIDDADDIAEVFTDFDLTEENLDFIAEVVRKEALPAIMWWLESTLSLERLIGEIKEASNRISGLIGSIKSFTHMDKSRDAESLNVLEGLKNTLMILKHQMKGKNIRIEKEIEENLPLIKGYAGELNQIWTNILDNAIDAMDHDGILTLKVAKERNYITVCIGDNGPGIPEEIINQIFDPFFTTKEVGKGTGMGLEVVRKMVEHHKGKIEVKSQPGNTTFKVSLPIDN